MRCPTCSVSEVMRSTTRLYANPQALDDPRRRRMIDELATLIRSVLVARERAPRRDFGWE